MQYPPSPPGQFGPPQSPQNAEKTGALAWYGRQRRATKAGIVSFVAVLVVFGSLGLLLIKGQAQNTTTVILPTQTATVTAVSQNMGSPTAAPSPTPTLISMQAAVVTPIVPTVYVPPTPTPNLTPTAGAKTTPTVVATAKPPTFPTSPIPIPTQPTRRRGPLPIPTP